MLEVNYGQVYSGLNFGAACIVFFKKNGDIRTMLATRNRAICTLAQCSEKLGQLNYRDGHCNFHTGTMAVMDLILGEVRAFSTEKIAHMEWLPITNDEEFDAAILRTNFLADAYKVKVDEMQTMDGLDTDISAEAVAPEQPNQSSSVNVTPEVPEGPAWQANYQHVPVTATSRAQAAPNIDAVKKAMEDNPELTKEQAEEQVAVKKFAAYMRGPGLMKKRP